MTITASLSSGPADVIAALYRGHARPHGRIAKRTVQRAIRAAQARGESRVILLGRVVVW